MAFQAGEGFVDFTARDSKLNTVASRVRRTMRGVQNVMLKVSRVARNMLLVSAGAIAGFIKLHAEQEKAEKSLDAPLISLGESTEKWSEALRQAASDIQAITTIGDEFTLGLFSQALNLGIAVENLDSTTRSAIGLSRALKIDLNTALRFTALAFQGETTILRRYIPALRQTEDATEQLAIVQRLMNAGFEQAQAETETLSGRLTQLKNRLGDVGERLGRAFLPLLDKFTSKIEAIATVVERLGDDALDKLAESAKKTGTVLIALWLAPTMIRAALGLVGIIGGVTASIATMGTTAAIAAGTLTGVFGVALVALGVILADVTKQTGALLAKLISVQEQANLSGKTVEALRRFEKSKTEGETQQQQNLKEIAALTAKIKEDEDAIKKTRKENRREDDGFLDAAEIRVSRNKRLIDLRKEENKELQKSLDREQQIAAAIAQKGKIEEKAIDAFAKLQKSSIIKDLSLDLLRLTDPIEAQRQSINNMFDDLIDKAKKVREELIKSGLGVPLSAGKVLSSRIQQLEELRRANLALLKQPEPEADVIDQPDIPAQARPEFIGLADLFRRLATAGQQEIPQQQLEVQKQMSKSLQQQTAIQLQQKKSLSTIATNTAVGILS